MANPSLQIGNSNWAIKEDNLLGYSTAGTRFVPQPITMTRESAGTRVNSSGLVETVELLGSEEVKDGSFPSGTTAWSDGTGVTLSVGKAELLNTPTYSFSLSQTLTELTVGLTYLVSYEIDDYLSGQLRSRLGSNLGATISDDGVYQELITAQSNSLIFQTIGVSFTGSIKNVSVKESTKNNLARVDYDGTASSLLVEPMRTNLIPYSEEISQYNQSSSTASDNETISPDGTNNASKISKDGVNANDRVTTIITISNSTDYSLSAFIKNDDVANGGVSTIGARITGGTVFRQGYEWNGSTLSVTNSSQSGTRTNVLLEDYGNGWWKVGFSFTSDGTEARLEFDIDRVNGTDTTAIFLWAVQTEAGSYGTSYIPNFGTALGVTRVQDQYSKTGISNLINSEEGVLFVEMAALPQTGRISLSDGTSTNRISFKFTPTNIDFQYRVSSSYSYRVDVDLDTSINHKIAMSFDNGRFVGYLDGNPIGSIITGASLPANTLNSLQLNDGASADYFFGKVKQLQVFKTALTDDELETLTT